MQYDAELYIDPGIHTALAYWTTGRPSVIQVNASRKCTTPEEKLTDLVVKVNKCIMDLRNPPKNVYIEGVQFWAGSLISMTSATRGNLSLLAYLVGVYFQYFNALGMNVEIVPPTWKGQLTDDALAVWIERRLGTTYATEHERAAVGLGLYKRGQL